MTPAGPARRPAPRISQLVGRNIRRLRKQQRLTVEQLARRTVTAEPPGGSYIRDGEERTDDAGVTSNALGLIERGFRQASVDDLLSLAAALNVPATVLLGLACRQCFDTPPPGFACNTCGAVRRARG